jgi:hypothetical protein
VANGSRFNATDKAAPQPGIALSPALQRFLTSLGMVTLIDPEIGTLMISRAELLALLGVSQTEIDSFLAQARASSGGPPDRPPDPDLVTLRRIIEIRRIGRNIKRLRKSTSLSLRDVHRLAGINPTYLSQLERGLRAASVDTLVQISIVLNTTLAELVAEFPLW